MSKVVPRQGLDEALREIERALPSGRILMDPDVLEQYSHDESEVAPRIPDAVVRAGSTEDVAAVMRAASRHGVPVTPRAGGTGRTGGSVPVAGGIVLAFDQMRAIKGIEKEDLVAVVEPGVVTGVLHQAVEAEGLFYPPDPNSLDSCGLGGNIAENAGGPRAFKYGVTREHVLGMEVVTADGTVLELGKRTVKGVTGYDLAALVVGSEGTLAIVTEATLKLVPLPERVATMLVLLPDVLAAGRAIAAVLARRIVPRCIELLDAETLGVLRPLASVPVPENAGAMLIVELDGDEGTVEHHLGVVGGTMDDAGAIEVLVARQGAEREKLWAARREMSHALRRRAKFKLAEDVVVPRSRIGALLDRARVLSETHGIRMPTYGHAGDGNLHVNFLWDDEGQRASVDRAIRALFEAVIEMGGTLSGEHGIGVLKAQYLGIEQSPELIALQERVKDLFDPKGVLNPGKIFPGAVKRFHGAC